MQLDLNNMGLVEMNQAEMEEVIGGSLFGKILQVVGTVVGAIPGGQIIGAVISVVGAVEDILNP